MVKKFFLVLIMCAATATSVWAEHAKEGTEWVTAYWYNANDNKLPRVLLIGDSICNGYQTQVRNELAGTAYVAFYASSKCVTDRSYLKELSYILEEYDYAVIHFNNGLHSLNTDAVEWESGLRRALQVIREKGKGAKIIWATSTPLKNHDLTEKAKTLNAIAARVMQENNIPVDDLFALMDPMDRGRFWTDTYHYNDEAKKLQAKQVAAVIRSVMEAKTASSEEAKKSLSAAASETGPDGKIITAAMSVDAVVNPGFENAGGWMLYPPKPENGSFSFDAEAPHGGGKAAKIIVKHGGLQFYQVTPKLEAEAVYELKFWARSAASGKLTVNLRTQVAPYKFYGEKTVELSPEWKEYSTILTLPADFQAKKHFLFFIFPEVGSFWLDDISVIRK